MEQLTSKKRTLSSSNVNAAEQIHEFIKIQQNAVKDQMPLLQRDVTKSSMILPEQYSEKTLKLCVDVNFLNTFEGERHLNWCADSRFLLPLYVEADGNSLLHSLSVYMFGVQDRRCVLRQILYQRLFMEVTKGLLKQRWTLKNDTRSSITWTNIIEMVSDKKHDNRYTDLNGIHVFAMANILARPIIIICENNISRKDGIGGIYLPLLRKTSECEKSPIILSYRNGHYVPLVSSENSIIPLCKNEPSENAHHCVPLVDCAFNDIRLQFLLPREELDMEMIRNTYLDVINIAHTTDHAIPAAMLKFKTPPAFSIELMWSLDQVAMSTDLNPSTEDENVYLEPVDIRNDDTVYTTMSAAGDNADAEYESIPSDINAVYETIDIKQNLTYESLIPCAERSNGCPNYLSSNNQRGMCTECDRKYFSQRNVNPCSRKSLGCPNPAAENSQNMCVFCYQVFIAARSEPKKRKTDVSPNQVSSNTNTNPDPVRKCKTIICQNVGLPGLNGKCLNCFTNENPQVNISGQSDVVRSRNTVDATYDNLSQSQSNHHDSNHSDHNYENANNDGVYDQLNRVSSVHTTPLPVKPVKPPRTFVDTTHKTNTNVPVSTHNFPPHNFSNSTSGAASPDAVPLESVRSKVLCNVAGCTSSIGADGKHCNVHNPQDQNVTLRKCIMKGCTNSSEFNDSYLCMVCFQSQKHVVRENKVRNFDFKSIANELPPIPIPSFGEQPQQQQQQQQQQPMRFSNPNFPQNIPNIPNNMAATHSGALSGQPSFTPPLTYGGFNKNFSTHNATLNWQKGGGSPGPNETIRKCLHCDNHANPAKGGLCNECHRQRESGIQHEDRQECITDGCKGIGSERFNFLCVSCYKKQIDALNATVTQPEDVRIVNTPQDIPNIPNIPDIPNIPVTSHQGRHGDLTYGSSLQTSQVNEGIVGASMHGGNPGMQNCKGLNCEFFGSAEFGGYCSACFMNITKKEAEKEKGTIRTFAPPENVGNHPNAATPLNCKGYQCPNFGSTQRMGYCSQCFLLYGTS